MNIFTEPHFQTDEAARRFVEGIRWPNGPLCPHCGEKDRRYATNREGRWRCGNPECRKDFTVTTGTVMEASHIGLHKWLLAFYLLCASKKGISAHQLMRSIGVTYKSAWFMAHRIREAMRAGGLVPPLGGEGKIVEADETYYGKADKPVPRSRGRIPTPTKKGRSGLRNGLIIARIQLFARLGMRPYDIVVGEISGEFLKLHRSSPRIASIPSQ